MNKKNFTSQTKKQRGVALIISMILLTVISMLSISAMRASILDSRIAANNQHKLLSFQVAESALAKLASDQPQVNIPTADSGAISHGDYISFAATAGHPALSADMELAFIRQAVAGEFKVSGYSVNVRTRVYQADAFGRVVGSRTRTHNRSIVVLVDKN